MIFVFKNIIFINMVCIMEPNSEFLKIISLNLTVNRDRTFVDQACCFISNHVLNTSKLLCMSVYFWWYSFVRVVMFLFLMLPICLVPSLTICKAGSSVTKLTRQTNYNWSVTLHEFASQPFYLAGINPAICLESFNNKMYSAHNRKICLIWDRESWTVFFSIATENRD